MRLALLPLALFALSVSAQSAQVTGTASAARVVEDDEWCQKNDRYRSDRYEHACTVTEIMIPASALDISGHPNGGVSVKQWDRDDVLIRARVEGQAPTQAQANRLVSGSRVDVRDGQIRAHTPDARHGSATVTFEVFTPRDTDLTVTAVNGPLSLHGLRGTIRAEAVNGPVTVDGLAGDVQVGAMNGPVSVDLDDDRWRGTGLNIEATNGPISLSVPGGYSADLAARTSYGRITTSGVDLSRAERPRGRRTGDALRGQLGRGGAVLSLVATNGPVQLRGTR